jgi:hypothetical protein
MKFSDTLSDCHAKWRADVVILQQSVPSSFFASILCLVRSTPSHIVAFYNKVRILYNFI